MGKRRKQITFLTDFVFVYFQINNCSKMTDSDSDSDCDGGLVRLSSGPPEFETAPREIEFKLKVKNERGKWTRCVYTLKKDSLLPYKPTVPGWSNFHKIVIYIYSERC